MNKGIWRTIVAVGFGLGLLPASVWAGCEEAPLFSSVSSQDVYNTPKTFVVSARKKTNCALEPLNMTVVGLLARAEKTTSPGEVSLTISLPPLTSYPTTFYATYTVTDAYNHVNTVTLPVRFGVNNMTPVLSPISDLVMLVGQTASFTVEATDQDGNLPLTEDGLRIDGLPGSARKGVIRLAGGDIVWRVSLTPTTYERGVYRVLIRGKDNAGAQTLGEMRLEIR